MAKRILVIKLGALGDLVLASAAFAAVRQGFPEAEITILTTPAYLPLVRGCPHFSGHLLFNRNRPFLPELLRLRRQLAGAGFGLVINLQNNFKAAILARLTRAPLRAGFQKGPGLGLQNRPVRYDPGVGALDNLNRVLARAGAPAGGELELYLAPATEAAAREKLIQAGWKGETLIGLHPGSSREWPAKRWPAEHWARLSSALEELGWRPLFLGDREAAAEVREILARTPARSINLAGQTNLEELSALIKRCRAFVSNDSGPLFLAAAAGIRTIGLYGPTAGKRHAPPGVTILETGLECQPCYRRRCPRPRCLEGVRPEEVLRRLSGLEPAAGR